MGNQIDSPEFYNDSIRYVLCTYRRWSPNLYLLPNSQWLPGILPQRNTLRNSVESPAIL